MVDSLRLWPHIRARIDSGPLGLYLVPYVTLLRSEGFTDRTVRRHVCGVDVFGAWLTKQTVLAQEIDESTLERFAGSFRRPRSPSRPRGRIAEVVSAVRKFVAFLRTSGVASAITIPPPVTEADHLLRSFEEYLGSVKGVGPVTRRRYLRYAQGFLETKFGPATPDWSNVGVDDIVDFVRVHAAKLKPTGCRLPVTAIRTFLRYLALTGAVGSGLCGAVPTIRQWKHASLPACLSADDVERVLDFTDGETTIRHRDRAILLLLARLGLRASEVARLRIDDVDWGRGRFAIRAGKSGCPRCLPLPGEVGEALVVYLRNGRPDRRSDAIFLRALPPHRPLSAAGVSAVAKRALRRAGVSVTHFGSHVFRHSAATRMIRRGATFKEVGDVLGHACLETTTIYAKLDLETLSGVALPWPGGA